MQSIRSHCNQEWYNSSPEVNSQTNCGSNKNHSSDTFWLLKKSLSCISCIFHIIPSFFELSYSEGLFDLITESNQTTLNLLFSRSKGQFLGFKSCGIYLNFGV